MWDYCRKLTYCCNFAFPGGMKITYGLNLNLPCTVDSWPQASVIWTLPNGLVLDKPQSIGRVFLFPNGTLQLRKVATFDKGTYICKASNSFGSTTLSYPVAVMVFPPQITNTLTSITRANRGSPVKLNCVATGIPKPDISWTLPGRTTLVPHNRFTVEGGIHMTEEGSLVIQNTMLMNSGIYKCNAKNTLGTDFKSTYLQVVWLTITVVVLGKCHSRIRYEWGHLYQDFNILHNRYSGERPTGWLEAWLETAYKAGSTKLTLQMFQIIFTFMISMVVADYGANLAEGK